MNLHKDTIGIQIREAINQVRETIEAKLIEISDLKEWFIGVDYTCEVSISTAGSSPIKDYLIVTVAPYQDDKKQGEYKFSFTSHEAIFLNDICSAIYKIILNPHNAEHIIFNAKVKIEYLQ